MTQLVTLICLLGIWALFVRDRDTQARASRALWIPVSWILITESRMVSQWLSVGLGAPTNITGSADVYLDGSPLDRNILTALMVLGIGVLIGRRQRLVSLVRQNVPILVFVLYCAVSIVWSDFPDVAFKRWTKFLGDLIMVMVVVTDPDPSAALRRLLARTAFLLLPLSELFIKYYPNIGRAYRPWTWDPYFTGVTTNKNMLGMICLVLGLGSLWRFLVEYRHKQETGKSKALLVHGIMLGLVFLLLHQSNSATALSCFVLGGGLMVLVSRRAIARRPALVHLLVVAVISVAFSALFLGLGTLVGTLGRDSTLTGRSEIWSLVLSMTTNPLLGTGFESFWLGPRLEKIWSVYWFHPNEAHNGYIEVFLNLGWVGLALLAAVIVTGYRKIIRAVCSYKESGSLRLAFFVVTLMYNFTEAAFKMFHPVFIFFVLAIFGIPEASVQNSKKKVDGFEPLKLPEAVGVPQFFAAAPRCSSAEGI